MQIIECLQNFETTKAIKKIKQATRSVLSVVLKLSDMSFMFSRITFDIFRITICHILNYMVQIIIAVLEGSLAVDCGFAFTRCNAPCKNNFLLHENSIDNKNLQLDNWDKK